MRGIIRLGLLCALLSAALFNVTNAQDAVRPPAQYKDAGSFSGGIHEGYMVIPSVRFGSQDDGRAIRMVIDLQGCDSAMGNRTPAPAHPIYSVTWQPNPYRLIVKLENTFFDPRASIDSSPALPFSVVVDEAGLVREIQIYMPGPSEFKVIEIDDPAKLSIDVRPQRNMVAPEIYTVQVTGIDTAEEAFALVESGQLPEGYAPHVLVLGSVVVVEQVFGDPVSAAQANASLGEMGYASVINERRGDELPLQ